MKFPLRKIVHRNGSLCSSVSIEIKYDGDDDDEDHWKYKKGMKMGKEIKKNNKWKRKEKKRFPIPAIYCFDPESEQIMRRR